ncbi:tail fiber assembly protein [Pseudomonas sp. S191]|uniref:tail fiber assembly protein n=1 Tax=Pseudomonas sp. S191 TaxID=579575 RepID=UPI00387B5417
MTKFYIVFNDDGTLQTRLPMDADVDDPLPNSISSVAKDLWLRTIQENDGVWKRDKKGKIGKFPFPPATAEEILAANISTQTVLAADASRAMTPLLLSLQLGDATDEEVEAARTWQAYSRTLKAVDLTAQSPTWPDKPDI